MTMGASGERRKGFHIPPKRCIIRDMAEERPARRPDLDVARYEFQRSAVTYTTTSLFLWVVWLMSGSPGGLPGVEAVGSNITASLGVFPAWMMLLGLPRLMHRAWEVYAPRPELDGGVS